MVISLARWFSISSCWGNVVVVVIIVVDIIVVVSGVHVRTEKIEKRKEQLDMGHFHFF